MNHEDAIKLNKMFCEDDNDELNNYDGPIRSSCSCKSKIRASKKAPEGEGHSEASYYCAYNQCGWL